MKKYLILILLAVSFTSFAQDSKIKESAPLGDLEEGLIKLLLLKNGNTAFIHFNAKKGFRIKLFDITRKQIADKQIEPSFGKFGMYGAVESAFSINNEIVIVMSTVKKLSTFKANHLLYRIIINGNTAGVVKDEQIGQLSPFGSGGETAFREGYLESPGFYVCKDPNSDNYAVAHFDSFESDRNKRLKLTHYGTDHKIINEGYFLSLNDDFKYISFSDMTVVGDSKLYVCASVYNTQEDKIQYTSIGCLSKENPNFTQKILAFTKNKNISGSMLYYNKHNKSLVLFSLTNTGSEDNSKFMGPNKSSSFYTSNITVINPATLTIDFESELSGPTLQKDYENKYMGNQIVKKGKFNGVPQGFYINDDQTYTIVYQELTEYTTGDVSNTFLGAIGVSILNDKFQEVNAYLIPYCSFATSEYGPLWGANKNYSPAENLTAEDHFKLHEYFNTGSKKIILYNQMEENFQKVKEGKITLVSSMGAADGYKVTIDEGKLTSERFFPKVEKAHTFGLFTGSCYDPSTETFVTITRSNKKGWQNQIVWMKL